LAPAGAQDVVGEHPGDGHGLLGPQAGMNTAFGVARNPVVPPKTPVQKMGP
jgi:hypothetical protein